MDTAFVSGIIGIITDLIAAELLTENVLFEAGCSSTDGDILVAGIESFIADLSEGLSFIAGWLFTAGTKAVKARRLGLELGTANSP